MSQLNFSGSVKCFNMTPFKFSVCCLIHSFLKDKELNSRYDVLVLLDGIKLLVNEYHCEINIGVLYHHLQKIVKDICEDNQIGEQGDGIFEYVKSILSFYYKSVNSINDLFIFFNNNLRKLETKDDHNSSILESGGFIYSYVRKCLFAFYKLSFEELSNFFKALTEYVKCEDLQLELTDKEAESVFSRQLNNFNFCVSDTDETQMNQKILESRNYKQKFYFYAKQDKSSSKLQNNT